MCKKCNLKACFSSLQKIIVKNNAFQWEYLISRQFSDDYGNKIYICREREKSLIFSFRVKTWLTEAKPYG